MPLIPSDSSSESDIMKSRFDPLRPVVWGAALALSVAALLADPAQFPPAARTTIGPFATLAGLIAGGIVADRLGVFRGLARVLIPSRASSRLAFAAVLVFTAALSGLVNLDVAVVVALPVALRVARGAGLSASRLCIAIALTANAASFLLPTSNLTTLLILSRIPLAPWTYLRESWAAWLLVCGATICGLTLLLARRHEKNAGGRTVRPLTIQALLDLGPLFVCASALRALLGAGVTLPGHFLAELMTGSLVAACVNNLPAAAAVHAAGTSEAWAAILAMAIGPNLIVTGSIATLICRRLARDDAVQFSFATFSLLGLVLVPVELLAAGVGLLATGVLR